MNILVFYLIEDGKLSEYNLLTVLKPIYLTLLVTIMSQLAQKGEYFGFLPDLGWEVKLVYPFDSFR